MHIPRNVQDPCQNPFCTIGSADYACHRTCRTYLATAGTRVIIIIIIIIITELGLQRLPLAQPGASRTSVAMHKLSKRVVVLV